MQEISSTNRATPVSQPQRPTHVREHPPDKKPERTQETKALDQVASAKALDQVASAKASAPNFGAGGSHARLSYDFEEADVYIEILNPRTGDVIRRLPPKDAVPLIRDIANAGPGAVIDSKV